MLWPAGSKTACLLKSCRLPSSDQAVWETTTLRKRDTLLEMLTLSRTTHLHICCRKKSCLSFLINSFPPSFSHILPCNSENLTRHNRQFCRAWLPIEVVQGLHLVIYVQTLQCCTCKWTQNDVYRIKQATSTDYELCKTKKTLDIKRKHMAMESGSHTGIIGFLEQTPEIYDWTQELDIILHTELIHSRALKIRINWNQTPSRFLKYLDNRN